MALAQTTRDKLKSTQDRKQRQVRCEAPRTQNALILSDRDENTARAICGGESYQREEEKNQRPRAVKRRVGLDDQLVVLNVKHEECEQD